MSMALKCKNHTFGESYFSNLPLESIVDIFSYVDIADLENFCDAYAGFEYLFKEKTLTSKLDLSRYHKTDLEQLSSNINPSHVTSLNVNGCHWIPARVLRDFIKTLVNLKELSALRTELCFSDEDSIAYFQTKIEKIALTLTASSQDPVEVKWFPSITTLCLEMFGMKSWVVQRMLRIFPNLEKLWIESRNHENITGFNNNWLTSSPETVRKVNIVCSEGVDLISDLSTAQLQKYYFSDKDFQPQFACFETFENVAPKSTLPTAWMLLVDLQSRMPYGPKDARRLHLGEETLDTIRFEEVNFLYCSNGCARCLFPTVYKEIMESPNVDYVKKLALPTCCFEHVKYGDGSLPENRASKRPRQESALQMPETTQLLLERFKQIQHLELFLCQRGDLVRNDTYKSIRNLTELRFLYVEIPISVNTKFIIGILKHCKQLETLCIDSRNQNSIDNDYVIKALQGSKADKLKEFTFKKDRLDIDKILVTLISMKGVKLRKLTLICKKTCRSDKDQFRLKLFCKYLRANPQLTHCLLKIKSMSEIRCKKVQQMVNERKMPHTLFFCNGPISKRNFPLYWDFREMKDYNSSVCRINLQRDSETF